MDSVSWFIVVMSVSIFLLGMSWILYLRYWGKYRKVTSIFEFEMEFLDEARQDQPEVGLPYPGLKGKTRFSTSFSSSEGIKVKENGIMAWFGMPKWHRYGKSQVTPGDHIVVEARPLFYTFSQITGIYPIEMTAGLYLISKRSPVFPGVQIETADYRTAVAPFRYKGEKKMKAFLEALGPNAETLFHPDEVIVGSCKVVGGTDGDGTTIMGGDLYKHKLIRDKFPRPSEDLLPRPRS